MKDLTAYCSKHVPEYHIQVNVYSVMSHTATSMALHTGESYVG